MLLANIIELHTVFDLLVKEKTKAGLAHKILQIYNILQPHFEQYEKTRVNKVIEMCGEKNKNEQGSYTVPQEKKGEFINFINEYISTDISIELPTISLQEIENLEIQPNHLNFLLKTNVVK
ncbi:MAG: hypothetical protein EKK56_00895 [Flavobacteriaceae bacterium]|nr:MAG: hypothetical protein EKK56_00895 [Flavobacteriaceae bacterium]